jgi:hypothetical protein
MRSRSLRKELDSIKSRMPLKPEPSPFEPILSRMTDDELNRCIELTAETNDSDEYLAYWETMVRKYSKESKSGKK